MSRQNRWTRAGAAWSLVSGEHGARVWRLADDGEGFQVWAWRVYRSGGVRWFDLVAPLEPGIRADGRDAPTLLAFGEQATSADARDDADRALIRHRFTVGGSR